MWESIHGREAGKSLECRPASGKGLHEELLVGAKVGHSHLVMQQLRGKNKIYKNHGLGLENLDQAALAPHFGSYPQKNGDGTFPDGHTVKIWGGAGKIKGKGGVFPSKNSMENSPSWLSRRILPGCDPQAAGSCCTTPGKERRGRIQGWAELPQCNSHAGLTNPKKTPQKSGEKRKFLVFPRKSKILPGLGWCLWWGARRIRPQPLPRGRRGHPEGKPRNSS